MKMAILQNADFERPGRLLDWAQERGLAWEVFRAYEGARPDYDAFTHFISLGAPIGMGEIQSRDWLAHEAELLLRAIEDPAKKVLGICFGAQLITHLLGGEVVPADHVEIGWHRTEISGKSAPLFQWHRYKFTLPRGAKALGSSEACPLQAYSHGSTWALAAHPEINAELVRDYIARCWPAEGFDSLHRFVQSPEQMMDQTEEKLAESKKFIWALLDEWAGIRANP